MIDKGQVPDDAESAINVGAQFLAQWKRQLKLLFIGRVIRGFASSAVLIDYC